MCGIAMIRLKKPLEYYQEKYGTWKYGMNKLYLLMEKQHNRGQEGAGLAAVKFDMEPGNEYIWRERAEGKNAIQEIFASVNKNYASLTLQQMSDATFAKEKLPFAGELYLGHLRYSTTNQKKGVSYVHPFMRRHNWKDRTLVLAGNFNLTNVDELFDHLTSHGQHPRDKADTFLMLETIGHELDKEVGREYLKARETCDDDLEITKQIERDLDIPTVIRKSEKHWDGGYAICGLLGHGDAFVFRDAKGIRPVYYYSDDEIVVVASERPVIQTAMDVAIEDVHELVPGQAMIVKKDGRLIFDEIRPQAKELKRCSFERIYFSRGSDRDIYQERKKLGELLAPQIMKAVDNDVEHTVFSFIPNTAEVAFYGMVHGIQSMTGKSPRVEKVLIKDIKLRTFIAQDAERNDLAQHVYDISYGSITPNVDNVVLIDDSIVRGTTLKQSIIKILYRLQPKKIVFVSSAPQVRYPDCYGIDMSSLTEFIAFKATMELLREKGKGSVINEVYRKAKAQQHLPKEQIVNYIQEIYKPFTDSEVSAKIAQMLTPSSVKCPVEIIYQTLDGLHQSMPEYKGDWYFSGDYPTAGGNRVVNNAFISYIENNR